MLAILIPLALQASAPAGEFYQPESSEAVLAVWQEYGGDNPKATLEGLESLATQGDEAAIALLGEIYSFGLIGVARDRKRACDLFEQVQSDRPDVLHQVATCYYDNIGRNRDLEKSRSLYARAAEGRFRQSLCAYGNMLIRGEGGPKNEVQGLELCKEAAIAGDRQAQTDYGGYLLMGVGVEPDPVSARFILQQAAEQEQANVAFLLGQIHTKGDGTAVDHKLATEWFEKAYEYGRPDAAFQAAMSHTRQGFQQDGEQISGNPELLRKAVTWFEVAAERDPDASRRANAGKMIENVSVLIAALER